MKRFWISWEHTVGGPVFELDSPWWISGYGFDGDMETICAAVLAENEEAAKRLVLDSYDESPGEVEWRFCNERPDDWTPFCDRFRQAKWMKWPTPKPQEPR